MGEAHFGKSFSCQKEPGGGIMWSFKSKIVILLLILGMFFSIMGCLSSNENSENDIEASKYREEVEGEVEEKVKETEDRVGEEGVEKDVEGKDEEKDKEDENIIEDAEKYLVDVSLESSLSLRKTAGVNGDEDIVERLGKGRLVKVFNKHEDSVVKDDFVWWEVKDPFQDIK